MQNFVKKIVLKSAFQINTIANLVRIPNQNIIQFGKIYFPIKEYIKAFQVNYGNKIVRLTFWFYNFWFHWRFLRNC